MFLVAMGEQVTISALSHYQEWTMTDTVEAIEEEIEKIKARIRALNNEGPGKDCDKKIQDATISLLNNVIKDLRKQQKKLRKAEQ